MITWNLFFKATIQRYHTTNLRYAIYYGQEYHRSRYGTATVQRVTLTYLLSCDHAPCLGVFAIDSIHFTCIIFSFINCRIQLIDDIIDSSTSHLCYNEEKESQRAATKEHHYEDRQSQPSDSSSGTTSDHSEATPCINAIMIWVCCIWFSMISLLFIS